MAQQQSLPSIFAAQQAPPFRSERGPVQVSSYAAEDMPRLAGDPTPGSTAGSSSTGSSMGSGGLPPVASRRQRNLGDEEVLPPAAMRLARVPWDRLSDIQVFGRGSFGVLYRGTWRGTDVAVKVPAATNMMFAVPGAAIRGEAASFASEAERELLAEANTMAGVPAHPRVLSLLGTTQEPAGLIFPFVERGSAQDVFMVKPLQPTPARTDLEWSTAVNFLLEAAAGVLHLHKEGIIHRDLAARNILVDSQYHALVSDFGLARVKDASRGGTMGSVAWGSGGGTMTHLGPVKYEAPECLAVLDAGVDMKPFSPATDVYAFGVAMYEVATGMEPWSGYSLFQAWTAVSQGYRLSPPKGDPVVGDLMVRCWAPDPASRPSMQEVVDTLSQHLKSGAVPSGRIADVMQDAQRFAPPPRPAIKGKGAPVMPQFLAPPKADISPLYVEVLQEGAPFSPTTSPKREQEDLPSVLDLKGDEEDSEGASYSDSAGDGEEEIEVDQRNADDALPPMDFLAGADLKARTSDTGSGSDASVDLEPEQLVAPASVRPTKTSKAAPRKRAGKKKQAPAPLVEDVQPEKSAPRRVRSGKTGLSLPRSAPKSKSRAYRR